MSFKVKTPTKEIGASAFNDLPNDVLKTGYLRKLKKMKRKFFVLRQSAGDFPSCLEYYTSEKKWRSGCDPKKTIILKTCFNISRKLHPKHKYVLCLYTQDECFSVVMETEEELDEWLSLTLELQLNEIESCEDTKAKFVYEHVWQVVVDDRELEFSKDISGAYCLGLTAKSISLIRMNSTPEKLKVLEFPLMSIRRCGHSGKHFFTELGRSAVTGAGGIWMETEGTVVAQNMHETILSAMKSSRNKGESGPHTRPRSASTSENSKPIATRRPIGVVLPQPLPLSSTFSNSREQCDTMPCRARCISENVQDPAYSTLSSVNSSSGIAYYHEDSRPHSFYAWPLNSPTLSNLSFSPSLSTSISSNLMIMTDDMDENIPPYQLSHCLHTQSSNTEFLSEPNVQEIPDAYLMMSPTDSNRNIIPGKTDYLNMNPANNSHSVSPSEETGDYSERLGNSPSRFNPVDYMDMKSPSSRNSFGSNTTLVKKRSNSSGIDHPATGKVPMKEGYMAMAPCGASDDLPVPMQDGYLSMSPISTSLPKHFEDFSTEPECIDNIIVDNDVSEFKLDKVQALVKQNEDDEQDFIKPVRAYSIGSRSQIYEARARAYSVGSERLGTNVKVSADVSTDDPLNTIQSTKSNSAPILQDSISTNKKPEPIKDQGSDLMEIDYRKPPEPPAVSNESSAKKSFTKTKPRSTSRSSCNSSPLLSLDEMGEKLICESKSKLPIDNNFQSDPSLIKMSNNTSTSKSKTESLLNCLDKKSDYFEMAPSSESGIAKELPSIEDSTNTTNCAFHKVLESVESHRPLSNRCSILNNDPSSKVLKSSVSNSATLVFNTQGLCSESHITSSQSPCSLQSKDAEKTFIARSQSFEGGKSEREYLYSMTIPVSLNTTISKSPSSFTVRKASTNTSCSNKRSNLLSIKSVNNERGSTPGEYINLFLKQPCPGNASSQPCPKINENQTRFATSTLPVALPDEPSYMNIKLGKPYTPLPNPALVSSSHSPLSSVESLKMSNTSTFLAECPSTSESSTQKPGAMPTRSFGLQSLPAIKKQMSAPAVPASLQHETVSPVRKSSCPVTASASMVKSFALSPSNSCRVVNLQATGGAGDSLKSYFSQSPDHNCVSVTDTATIHINPKVVTAAATANIELCSVVETQYENVHLPSTSSASSSRPSSVSSEKELNYVSLDLVPSGGNDVPHSPRTKLSQQQAFDKSESLTYAEIDFTKSEGLRHTSGALREGRL